MPKKTGGKTGRGHFRKGHDPRRGHGKKGRSGRPPKEFGQFFRDYFDSQAGRARLLAMAFREPAVMNKVLSYAYGQPPESVAVDLLGGLTVRIVHEYSDTPPTTP